MFEIVVAGTGLIAIASIFLAKAFRETDTIDRTAAGQLGDFVGGFVGTFFALLSVVLLVRTLREQRKSDRRERFENKYFEMIKMHRENVAEMKIKEESGRRVFVLVLQELRKALDIAKRVASAHNRRLSDEQFLQIAYSGVPRL